MQEASKTYRGSKAHTCAATKGRKRPTYRNGDGTGVPANDQSTYVTEVGAPDQQTAVAASNNDDDVVDILAKLTDYVYFMAITLQVVVDKQPNLKEQVKGIKAMLETLRERTRDLN